MRSGIAASLSSGLIQFSRAGNRRNGEAACIFGRRGPERRGLLAGNLAAEGFTGPHDAASEGEFRISPRISVMSTTSARLTRKLGEEFVTLSIYMKRFPCHGTAPGAVCRHSKRSRASNRFSGPEVN